MLWWITICLALLLPFQTASAQAVSSRKENPLKVHEKIMARIHGSSGQARHEAVDELWTFNRRLADRPGADTDVDACAALLVGAMELENLYRQGERPSDLMIREVLEGGRQAARRAIRLLEDAATKDRKSRKNRSQWIAWIEENLAKHLWEYARYLFEAYCLEEALVVLHEAESLDQPFMMPWIHLRRATVQRFRGRYQECRVQLEKADSLGQDVEESLRFDFVANLAWEHFLFFLDMGVPERAAWWLEQGRLAAEKASDPTALDCATLYEIIFHLAIEDHPRVKEMVEKALHSTEILKNLADMMRLRWAVACAVLDRKNRLLGGEVPGRFSPPKPDSTSLPSDLPEGLSTPRSVLEEIMGRGIVSNYEVHLAAMNLARMELDAGGLQRASQWLARAEEARVRGLKGEKKPDACARGAVHAALRARLLIDSNASEEALRKAFDALGNEYRTLVNQLSSMPMRKGGVGFLYYDHRRIAVCELIRLRLHLDGNEAGAAPAFEDLLLAQNLGSLSRALGVEPVRLATVQETLTRPGHGILAYLPAPDRSYLFLIDPSGVSAVELAPEEVLLSARADLVRMLRRSLDNESLIPAYERSARRLGELLMPGPVQERMISWNAVTLVGLDLLGWVPFECLPSAGGKPLGLEKAVDWLPSLAVGAYLSEGAKKRKRTVSESGRPDPQKILTLLAPEPGPAVHDLDQSLDPFQLTEEQVSSFVEATGSYPHELLLRAGATEERLARGSLEDVTVLCLFAHGARRKRIASSERREDGGRAVIERPATLVLSPSDLHDGLFGSDEVERIQSPPLVVLSSCGAAAGPVRYGDDGINHLGGAFFQAGARTVLHTRADLEVESTAALTTFFLENLVQRGMTPAEALRQARCAVATRREWSHPFCFALLQVGGMGHISIFPAQEKGAVQVLPWVVGGLLLGAILFFLFRLRSSRTRR